MKQVRYKIGTVPPGVKYEEEFDLSDLTVRDVQEYCRNLHSIVVGRDGAAWYAPDRLNAATQCIYDWPVDGSHRCAAHLVISANGIQSTAAYSYVAPEVGASQEPPQISKDQVEKGRAQIHEFLGTAKTWISFPPLTCHLFCFYITSPQHTINRATVRTGDDRVYLYPSFRDKGMNWVTPVIIVVGAPSRERAAFDSTEVLTRAIAVASLASSGSVSFKAPEWDVPMFSQIQNPRTLEELIYPPNLVKAEAAEGVQDYGPAFVLLWDTIHIIQDAERERFLQSLEAARIARDVEATEPILAVVSRLAALGSLAQSLQSRCVGDVSCSICGPVYAHNVVGDRAAICKLIRESLPGEPGNDCVKALDSIITRLYSERRSGFVHSAKIRDYERKTLSVFPPLIPTGKAGIAPAFEIQDDALVLGDLTEKVLVTWLSQRAIESSARHVPAITNWALGRISWQGGVAIPSDTEVVVECGTVLRLRTDPGKTASASIVIGSDWNMLVPQKAHS